MTNEPRSVKISDDERGAWSSDRPRKAGPPREPDVSTRCRTLKPSDRMRYSPGSLVVVVAPSGAERDRFLERVFAEDQAAVLSPGKIRSLIAGRVPEDQLDEKAAALLEAAALKRIESGESTVFAPDGLGAEERKTVVRAAAGLRRPRHVILLEVGRDELDDEGRDELNALRTALDAGELGQEGLQTAMRLGGATVTELKRIVFRPPPKDD